MLCAAICFLTLLTEASAAWPGDQAPAAVILMYHRFGDGRYPSTNTTIEDFRAHLDEIAEAGRPIVQLTDIVRSLRDGTSLPTGAVAITIDDAYSSIYVDAWPLLRERQILFTLFVATEPVAQAVGDYMTPAQLRELARQPGVSIANHGHTHHSLAFADKATVAA